MVLNILLVSKESLGIKFLSSPVHNKKYIKTKIKEYDRVIKTNFLDNGVPKENKHYTCIFCITIASVMRMDKKLSASLLRRMQI